MTESVEEVRARWDDFSTKYQATCERYVFGTYPILVEYLRNGTPERVLEVGCGPGLGATHLMRSFNSSVEITCSDLSPDMCELAKGSIAQLQSEVTDGVKFPKISVQIENGQELSFADNSFDRYISNMCIMIAPDTVKLLSECKRVLKDDGIAVFSVWGRKELSSGFALFDIVPKYAKMVEENKSDGNSNETSANATPAATRSNYHLGDEQKLRRLLNEAGFSRVTTWYSQSHFSVLSGKQYADDCFKRPPFSKLMPHLTREQFEECHAELTSVTQAVLDAGKPIIVDVLCAVVRP